MSNKRYRVEANGRNFMRCTYLVTRETDKMEYCRKIESNGQPYGRELRQCKFSKRRFATTPNKAFHDYYRRQLICIKKLETALSNCQHRLDVVERAVMENGDKELEELFQWEKFILDADELRN